MQRIPRKFPAGSRAIQLVGLVLFLFVCSSGICAEDEPRYLLPPGQTAPAAPQRSTYESLTEPRGSVKLRKDLKERRDKEEQLAKQKEQAQQQQAEEKPKEDPPPPPEEAPEIGRAHV